MHDLVTQHHIIQADMVSENWIFCLKIERFCGRTDTVFTIRGSDLLPEALLIIHIHLREVNKQLSRNGCMTL